MPNLLTELFQMVFSYIWIYTNHYTNNINVENLVSLRLLMGWKCFISATRYRASAEADTLWHAPEMEFSVFEHNILLCSDDMELPLTKYTFVGDIYANFVNVVRNIFSKLTGGARNLAGSLGQNWILWNRGRFEHVNLNLDPGCCEEVIGTETRPNLRDLA